MRNHGSCFAHSPLLQDAVVIDFKNLDTTLPLALEAQHKFQLPCNRTRMLEGRLLRYALHFPLCSLVTVDSILNSSLYSRFTILHSSFSNLHPPLCILHSPIHSPPLFSTLHPPLSTLQYPPSNLHSPSRNGMSRVRRNERARQSLQMPVCSCKLPSARPRNRLFAQLWAAVRPDREHMFQSAC